MTNTMLNFNLFLFEYYEIGDLTIRIETSIISLYKESYSKSELKSSVFRKFLHLIFTFISKLYN